MDIINIIYEECHSLGTNLGFGAFEGGVIYLSVFSLIIFKCVDAIKEVFDKKDNKVSNGEKREEVVLKVKVIK